MATYKLTLEAKDNLNRIWLCGVRKHGENQADAYALELFEHFDRLAHRPYLYQAANDIDPGYRRSVCSVDSVYF